MSINQVTPSYLASRWLSEIRNSHYLADTVVARRIGGIKSSTLFLY
jgi:hypothetical protein